MHKYIAKWKSYKAQFASMNASVDEGILIMTFVESVNGRANSPYGAVISALLTKDGLSAILADAAEILI